MTERRQADEALHASEARFRSVFEQSPIGIALYDSNGGLLDANRACWVPRRTYAQKNP